MLIIPVLMTTTQLFPSFLAVRIIKIERVYSRGIGAHVFHDFWRFKFGETNPTVLSGYYFTKTYHSQMLTAHLLAIIYTFCLIRPLIGTNRDLATTTRGARIASTMLITFRFCILAVLVYNDRYNKIFTKS